MASIPDSSYFLL